MICPKCQNVMRTVDRQGIHIDQCDGCRGIFLDRGELEQIVGAEQRHYAAPAAPPPYQGQAGHVPPPPPPAHYPAPQHGHVYRDSPHGYGHTYRDSPHGYAYRDSPHGYGAHGHRKRRKSFLEELFD